MSQPEQPPGPEPDRAGRQTGCAAAVAVAVWAVILVYLVWHYAVGNEPAVVRWVAVAVLGLILVINLIDALVGVVRGRGFERTASAVVLAVLAVPILVLLALRG